MELRRARAMFRLTGRVPMEELNSSFRDLVKKYHPDKVRDYPEWAHERMSEINNAYETLAAWISSPPVQESAPSSNVDENSRPSDGGYTEETEPYRRRKHALPRDIERIFYPVFNEFLDGLGLYYQYGLERPSYRDEGVRRFRYREALRTVENKRDDLEKLSSRVKHPAVKAAARFARLTAADMALGNPQFTAGPPVWKRFDNRLKTARRNFDSAIREILFPELLPSHRRGHSASTLYSSYTDFILYVTVFTEGERRKAGILQAARYDAFTDLLDLRNDGVLSF